MLISITIYRKQKLLNIEVKYSVVLYDLSNNVSSFNDFGSAIFSSDITQDINCEYIYELDDDGDHEFHFVFPVVYFGDMLPSYVKYTFDGKQNDVNIQLTISMYDIVWESWYK